MNFNLYLTTDRKLFSTQDLFLRAIEDALKGGIRALQLREKDLDTRDLLGMAYKLRDITKRHNSKLFINDRIDIAIAVGADGVHLGQSSIPAHAARKTAGRNILIGVSAHSIEEAKKAQDEGADFLTLGPIYETPSKRKYGRPLGLEILKKIAGEISVPIFAIGGIRIERVEEVLQAGAYGIALISAVLASKNIKAASEEFLRLIK